MGVLAASTMLSRCLFVSVVAVLVLCSSFAVSSSFPSADEDSLSIGRSASGKRSAPGATGAPLSCTQVRHIYAMKQLGPADAVPDQPVDGRDLEVCSSQMSCCTKEMELTYYNAVKKDYLNIMQSTSSYLKNLIATNVDKFQESFLDMLRSAENNTLHLLEDVHPRMASQAAEPVTKLFADLSDFLRGRDVDPEESVVGFFDALFPLVYHHSVNPKMKDLHRDYNECLRETQSEIRPFGDIAQQVSTQLTRSLLAARTLLHALHLGAETINGTDHPQVAPECQRALTRLLYCPHCRGLVAPSAARSCNGYCANVVRGCLASMAEMDQPWNDYVLALDRLAVSMKGGAVLEEVTSAMDTKISEAIMYAMENGPELSKKVKKTCGHPKRAARSIATSSENVSASNSSSSEVTTDGEGKAPSAKTSGSGSTTTTRASSNGAQIGLPAQMHSFMRSLSQSKGFYSSLADTLCNEDSLAVRSESNCWNGESLGEYTKTIAGVGISAQKYNPELKMQHWRDENVGQLIDKLKHMKQILNTRILSLPESDSILVNDGSGSGWSYNNNNNNFNDDEDYPYGSGSGYQPEKKWDKAAGKSKPDEDIDFNTDEENKPSITVRPSSASTGSTSLWLLVTSTCLALLYSTRLMSCSSIGQLNG